MAFQAAALVPVLAVGLVLLAQYRQHTTDETLRDARTQASNMADLAVGPVLPSADLSTVSPAVVQAAMRRVLSRPVVRSQVLRLKVWDPTGRVLASDAPELLGQHFSIDGHVAAALAGHGTSEITHLTDDENAQERRFGTAVEAYVPLHSKDSDAIVGVLEVYMPYEPLAADLRRGEQALMVNLGRGLLCLVLSLGVLTSAITARLRGRTRRAQHLADHDALTGLLSRSAFEQHLDQLVRAGEPAAVVLADLDDFKRINDALGHPGGDVLLRHAASALVAATPGGLVARLGGDEFALLLPGVDSLLDAENALARLHETLRTEVDIEGIPVSPAASLGAVLFPSQCSSAVGLLQRADTAMHVAKTRTSGAALYDPAHAPFDAAQLQLLADLRRAVPAGQLLLHYQPQVSAADGRLTSVEALVRWQHPERGLLAPGAFLGLAERTGLIVPLTRWVLDTAAAQVAAWDLAGLSVTCSVNISARDLADPSLVSSAVAAVRRHGVAAERLCLELTETAIMEDPAGARQVLTAVAAAGFEISLDDFGQGYTSLGQLRDLPLDEIKLDRSFVAGMLDSDADLAIVKTVLNLGHSLGLRVVAEGVETADQAGALRMEGFDVLQGWHTGRPATAQQLLEQVTSPAGPKH